MKSAAHQQHVKRVVQLMIDDVKSWITPLTPWWLSKCLLFFKAENRDCTMLKSDIATMPPVARLYGSVPMYCKVLEPCGREGEGEREDELRRRGKPRKWSSRREAAVATARVLDYFYICFNIQ